MDHVNVIGPVVDFQLLGEVHVEGNRLVVGDVDVLKKFEAAWGGGRQMGLLKLALYLVPAQTTEVSPSGNGTFAEYSEP